MTSFYLREKYPLIISNNIDPFSKSNQPFVNDLIFTLQDAGVPVCLATRGGEGWQTIADNITPSVWYVSIPYNDDETRRKYEPNAPTVESRYELIEYIIGKGHRVLLSINPLNERFAPEPLAIAERAKSLGVETIIINKLHLSPKQQVNLTAREKEVIGEDLLAEVRKRDFTEQWLTAAVELFEWCGNNEMKLVGMDTGLYSNNYSEFKECYTKVLPTVFDFFDWCYLNKEAGTLISFNDFFDFFAPMLPDIEGNISKYIFNKAVIDDKSFYKRMTIRNLLHLYWQHPKLNLGFTKHYPAFSWVKLQTEKKFDFLFDDDNNKLLYYHKDEFYTDELIVVQTQSEAANG